MPPAARISSYVIRAISAGVGVSVDGVGVHVNVASISAGVEDAETVGDAAAAAVTVDIAPPPSIFVAVGVGIVGGLEGVVDRVSSPSSFSHPATLTATQSSNSSNTQRA